MLKERNSDVYHSTDRKFLVFALRCKNFDELDLCLAQRFDSQQNSSRTQEKLRVHLRTALSQLCFHMPLRLWLGRKFKQILTAYEHQDLINSSCLSQLSKGLLPQASQLSHLLLQSFSDSQLNTLDAF